MDLMRLQLSDDRRRLIEEIENFAQCYPGNRILVTSRPVGYELAPFSNQQFSHVLVQDFNDQQIRTFLEHWYSHVLRLSPLPTEDQQELENLYKTLTENLRLHSLAANPLLLTVITALHRYERLPDRRILVYDRCADLLLNTWAKLRGTDVRWKDMKMGKEDQYSCVAYLGFVLHERSQEIIERLPDSKVAENTSSTEDLANDVTTRFIFREVEQFLKSRKLLSEVAEQRAEAERFLELMRVEAGLIVERGKDENGEDLYGFVHRTFQEYFAAVDVYERYLQEDDSTIISKFLSDHLHDPHWYEVVLLLFGKLKRKQATIQLRRILDGKSRLSIYTEVVKQDLFFVCACLTEEINVENDFAEQIVSLMGNLVRTSPFPSQQTQALEALASLIHTRQYADLGRRELTLLITQSTIPNISIRIQAAKILNQSSLLKLESEEQREATQVLVQLLRRTDLTPEQTAEVAQALYRSSLAGSETQREATKTLDQLLRRTDLSLEQKIEVAQALFASSSSQSEEKREAMQALIQLLRRTDLMPEQTIKITQSSHMIIRAELQDRNEGTQMLVQLLQRSDLTPKLTAEAAQTLYWVSGVNSDEEKQATQVLVQLLRRTDLSLEQTIEVTQALLWSRPSGYEAQREATRVLDQLLRRTDLTPEQTAEVAQALYRFSSAGSDEEKQATRVLDQLLRRTDLTSEQTIEVALALYRFSSAGSDEEKQATQVLDQLLRRTDLTPEQTAEVALALYQNNPSQTEEQREATQMLVQLLRRTDLTPEQTAEVAQALYQNNPSQTEEQREATQALVQLLRRTDLTPEQTAEVAQALYQNNPSQTEEQREATQALVQLLRRSDLMPKQTIEVAQALYRSSSIFKERREATKMLVQLLQRSDLTPEQTTEVALALYRSSNYFSVEQREAVQALDQLLRRTDLTPEQTAEVALAFREFSLLYIEEQPEVTQALVQLLRRTDLTPEQTAEVALALYQNNPSQSEKQPEVTEATQALVQLLQRSDLTPEQTTEVALALYRSSSSSLIEQKRWAEQVLLDKSQQQNLSFDKRLEVATLPLTLNINSYPKRVKAIQLVLSMTQGKSIKDYLEDCWQPPLETGRIDTIDVSDIPYIVEITTSENLPTQVRDEMYCLLRNIIPKFGEVSITNS